MKNMKKFIKLFVFTVIFIFSIMIFTGNTFARNYKFDDVEKGTVKFNSIKKGDNIYVKRKNLGSRYFYCVEPDVVIPKAGATYKVTNVKKYSTKSTLFTEEQMQIALTYLLYGSDNLNEIEDFGSRRL